MDLLTAFGLLAVLVMLAAYAVEHVRPAMTLVFAIGCLLASLYGWLQGAWPFGLAEGVWSLVAVRKWVRRRRGELP